MHKRVYTRQKLARARFIAAKRARARLRLVCAHVCTDLNKKCCGICLLSYECKCQISKRSELSLRRYLQNNNDFLKIINFQYILHISTVLLLQSLRRWIITEWLWNFFETRYQNGPTSGIIWHMSHLIDYFLA